MSERVTKRPTIEGKPVHTLPTTVFEHRTERLTPDKVTRRAVADLGARANGDYWLAPRRSGSLNS